MTTWYFCLARTMKIGRREFIHAGCTMALVNLFPLAVDVATVQGETINNANESGTGFNGGRSQINLNFANGTGEYPFMDLMKVATPYVSGGQQTLTPDICNSNGWPTRFPTGVTAVNYVVNMPSQVERPGNYDLSWTGTGVAGFIINGGMAVVSGSLTPSRGVGHAVVAPKNPAAGPGPNAVNLGFNGPAQNVRFCHVDDLTAVRANPNEFHPQFMAVLKALRPGVLRFLNWINGNQTAITDWASRTAPSYSSYQGLPLIASQYAGRSVASGSDLSVGLPPGGFTLADKARLQFYLSASPPRQATGTFIWQSTDIGVPNHGLANDNQVYLTGTAPKGFTATSFRGPSIELYFVTVVDVNTIRLARTKGGPALAAGRDGSCTINPYLTVSVNAGPAIPVWNNFSVPYPQSFVDYPTGGPQGSFRVLVYDATLGAFIDFAGGSGNCSVPPEVCLDLCYKIGAHPWFVTPFLALDPATDWLAQLGTHIKNAFQNGKAPWMVPRFETPNECWNNFGTNDTQYAIQKAIQYGWGTGSPGNYHNWIGKVASIGGQQLASVFGAASLGVTYHWIVGVQTSGGVGNSDDRLAASKFLASDPNPVQSPYKRYAPAGGGGGSPQNWVSHICVANYLSPLRRFACQELIDGYSYSVTNAGDPTAQAAIAQSYVDTLISHSSSATIVSSSPNIGWTQHGRSVGDQVVFLARPPEGFSIGQIYFVRTVVDENTITLSGTKGSYPIRASGSGSALLSLSGPFNLAYNFALFRQWKAWASAFGVSKMTAYEGGYSPDYLRGDWSTGISEATQANLCVLTLASTSSNPELAGMAGNPAVAGMAVTISGLKGMTQLNNSSVKGAVSFTTATTVAWPNSFSEGQTVVFFNGQLPRNVRAFVPYYVLASGLSNSGFQVSSKPGGPPLIFEGPSFGNMGQAVWVIQRVSGNQITLNVDSSAFDAHKSGGTLSYFGSASYSNALRGAGKLAANLQTYLTQTYNLFIAAGGEFPSCFQLANLPPPPGSDIWSILDDIYQPFSTSSQARAIQEFNAP
jgi:hypothetical protein